MCSAVVLYHYLKTARMNPAETLEKGWLLPWEGNHLLVELPINDPTKVGDIVPLDEVKRLLDMGYQPVLAHPERYAMFFDSIHFRAEEFPSAN